MMVESDLKTIVGLGFLIAAEGFTIYELTKEVISQRNRANRAEERIHVLDKQLDLNEMTNKNLKRQIDELKKI